MVEIRPGFQYFYILRMLSTRLSKYDLLQQYRSKIHLSASIPPKYIICLWNLQLHIVYIIFLE